MSGERCFNFQLGEFINWIHFDLSEIQEKNYRFISHVQKSLNFHKFV